MIIKMKPDASNEDIEYIIKRANSIGLTTYLSKIELQTMIGIKNDLSGLDLNCFDGLRGVEKVQKTSQPYRLCSLEFKGQPGIVSVGQHDFGGRRIIVMAGPCSVETSDQVIKTAAAIKAAGASFIRGGAFKPRSSPYSFQGLAEEGLKILAEARNMYQLKIITEVMSSEQVELVSRYADVLQIGTRNMQNYPLLQAVGETKLPVLLKRGMMSTIKELLLSAEYIISSGNPNVLLCERGIRTFESYTRNSLDINAIPALKELTYLPVIVDPSHATGKRSLVKAVSKAAVAAGADGLLIEVHPDPDKAWSDGYQSLTLKQFEEVMKEVEPIAKATGRSLFE